jgi:hypothetical protein
MVIKVNIKDKLMNIFSSDKYIQLKFSEDGSMGGIGYLRVFGIPVMPFVLKSRDIGNGNGNWCVVYPANANGSIAEIQYEGKKSILA